MRFLLVIFFVFAITHAYSQQLRVVGYTKYAAIKNGRSLKDGDTLSVHNTVVIKQGGELHLINKTGWGFYLKKGTYDLDSCFQMYKNIYRDYDSVKAIVDTIFPNGVKGQFRTVCGTSFIGNSQDRNYQSGNIDFLHAENNKIKATTDTVTIYWRDPQKYTGRYIIEFKNMYDEKIGYRISNINRVTINVNDFPNNDNNLLVTIYSEDGRKSALNLVQVTY